MDARIPDLALMNRLATSAPAAPKAGDKLADTARQFEALFVEQMLKTMRESSLGEGDALFPGQSGLFREMHDREVVKSAYRAARPCVLARRLCAAAAGAADRSRGGAASGRRARRGRCQRKCQLGPAERCGPGRADTRIASAGAAGGRQATGRGGGQRRQVDA